MNSVFTLIKSKIPALIHLLIFWIGFSKFIFLLLSKLEITSANIFLAWGMFFIFVGTVTYQIFYATLYYLEPEWAMKYKIVEMDWPWKTNPKQFKKTIFKQILVHVNYLFISKSTVLAFVWSVLCFALFDFHLLPSKLGLQTTAFNLRIFTDFLHLCFQ